MLRELTAGDDILWGEVLYSERLCDGVYDVSTSSHGGICVHEDSRFAQIMSDAAHKIGVLYGEWICFEEDADWAVAMNELIHSGLEFSYEAYEKDPGYYEGVVHDTLTQWLPKYAETMGA